MAASKSSGSKVMSAAIRPSASISATAEDLGAERIGSRVAARGARTTEDEPAAPDRNGVESHALDADLASAANSATTASRPFRSPAPTTRRRSSTENAVSQRFGHGVPVAGGEVRLDALIGLAAAFSSRGGCRCSSSKRASAASRSASSKIS